MIDPDSNRLVSTVPTGGLPAEVSADADHVWVANRGDDTVTQIDPATKEVAGTASPGTSVAGLAAGADGVWIGDSRREKLVRLDPASRSVAASIRLAAGPELFGESTTNPVAVGHGAVWVGRAVGEIARVDPKSDEVVAEIPVGNGPVAIATGRGRRLDCRRGRQLGSPDRSRKRECGHRRDSGGTGPGRDRGRRGRRLGGQHPGRHRRTDRSRHRGGDRDDCGRASPDGRRRGRGSGVGRQQPQRHRLAHRPGDESRRGDGGGR